SCTTATRSAWATTCISAIATACARQCIGRATATPASRAPTSPSSTCHRSWIRSRATKRSTSRRSYARPRRCCAGCTASSPCARSTRCSGSERTSRWSRTTRASSPTCAPSRRTSCCACTTWRAARRRSRSTSRSLRAPCPRNFSAVHPFPQSRATATSSRSDRAGSTGCSWDDRMLDLTRLPESELSAFIAGQPWFRAHGREGAAARVLEATFVHTVEPLLAIALVEVATERGLNELYQVPVGLRPEAEGLHLAASIASIDGWTAYDALSDPDLAYEIVDLVRTAASAHTDVSVIEFDPRAGPDVLSPPGSADLRPIGEGHSNTSVVVGEEIVLKVYRRLAPGNNPEL